MRTAFFLFMLFPVLTSFVLSHNGIDPLRLKNRVDREEMLKLVNEARKRGCRCGDTFYPAAPPVAWNNKLEQAALAHAGDMASKGYFSHTAPDGSRGGERIARTGYHWRMFGENIGRGFISEREMVEGWLNSPSHCRNIMNRNYKEMGVARVDNYWTQSFASQ